MNYNNYISQLKEWKSKFPKDKSYIEKIALKIDNQIKLEEELTSPQNLKSEKISYYHYNSFFKSNFFHSEKNKGIQKVFLKLTEKEELNHIINFYYNVSNRLNFFFPSFFPFFYGYENDDRNTLLFEKIGNQIQNGSHSTLKEFLLNRESNREDSIQKIYKVIFYQLQLLSTFFSFCHYNLTTEDFLVISMDPLRGSFKNYYINTICDENKSINELYQYIDYEELDYCITLNVFSENIKNCFFKVNQKNFCFVSKKDIKNNLKNNLIKIDRTNILTDIFSLLKDSLVYDLDNPLFKKLFSYFITDFDTDEVGSQRLNKIEKFLDFGNHYLSFDIFMNLFSKESNKEIPVEVPISKGKEYPKITRHDVMLDFIETYHSEMYEEEEFYIDTLENYIKDFNNSFFLKNLKEWCEEIEDLLIESQQNNNSVITEEFIKYVKINFYIFCKLKNYFFQDELESDFVAVQKIFKENLISVYNLIKKKNGQLYESK